MSLLSANISVLCDPTCYIYDPSEEEKGSGAQWGCCTWGYFSPSLKSRTISQNSKLWGRHTRVGTACRAQDNCSATSSARSRPETPVICHHWSCHCWVSPSLLACCLPWWVSVSACCQDPCSCLKSHGVMEWPLQHCRASPHCRWAGVAWGHACDRELWCEIYFQLCHKLPVFIFGANNSNSLSPVLPICKIGLSVLSSWEWSLNRSLCKECYGGQFAGWVQDSI